MMVILLSIHQINLLILDMDMQLVFIKHKVVNLIWLLCLLLILLRECFITNLFILVLLELKSLVIVGDSNAFIYGINNDYVDNRKTTLKDFIINFYNE